MKNATQTQKATYKAAIFSLLWLLLAVGAVIYLAFKYTVGFLDGFLASAALLVYLSVMLTCAWHTDYAKFLRDLRKRSPRANFFRLFDYDEKMQFMKRQAHCAQTPQEFEKAVLDICAVFYDEGFAVGQAEK
jgi:hypothetical protein